MTKLVLGVDASKHVTDEVCQLQDGLREAGWTLCGRGLDVDEVDVAKLLERHRPTAVLVQDRREWDFVGGWRDPRASFRNWECLRDHPKILRLGMLKDMQRPAWEHELQVAAGLDGWISPYRVECVTARCPWVDPERLVRTWHTVDAEKVPPFSGDRYGAVLSGYVGRSCRDIYPLRTRLFDDSEHLVDVVKLRHPGYVLVGCHSTEFLSILSKFKVAICTVSTRDFLLRKIIEASACGCVVVTNLSERERPECVEENLIRVSPDASVEEVSAAVERGLRWWGESRQKWIAGAVRKRYDWREVGRRLSADIDDFRRKLRKMEDQRFLQKYGVPPAGLKEGW